MDMPQFGEILAELRQDRGMTQQELSAKLHVAKSSISNLETGQRRAHTELIDSKSDVAFMFQNFQTMYAYDDDTLIGVFYVEESTRHAMGL